MRRFSSPGDRPTDRPKRRRLLIIRPASSRPRARRRPSIRPSARPPRARDLCARTYSPRASVASPRVASRRVASRVASRIIIIIASRVSADGCRTSPASLALALASTISRAIPPKGITSRRIPLASRPRRPRARVERTPRSTTPPPRRGLGENVRARIGRGTTGTRGRVMTGGGRPRTWERSIARKMSSPLG